jgi:hypothetical protein
VHGSFGRGFCDATCDGSESGLESAERWSKWQDLNLRPPRPERGALPAQPPFSGLQAAYNLLIFNSDELK